MKEKLLALLRGNGRLMELIRFGVTGGVCFVVEFAFLTLFVEALHMPVLWATALAFLISVAVNYALCVKWVFTGAKGGDGKVKLQFLITSGMGLGLNELLMWLMNIRLGVQYQIAKVIATLLVMVWNYITKRLVLRGGKA
ncbi:MAG: GtrA family protein [Clostridia bacterium]|nr:GtrA family protein [Clostridia bacterium]